MPGVDDIRHVANDEGVFIRGEERSSLPIDRAQMPAFEHGLHDLADFRIGGARNELDQIIDASSMVHKYVDRLDVDECRILDEGDIGREISAKLFGKSRLGFGSPDGIVVAGRDDDFQPVRQSGHKIADMVILFINCFDIQLLVLIRIDTDPIHNIAGDKEISDILACLHPCRELLPCLRQKCIAAHMDIGDKHGLALFFRGGGDIRQRDIRPIQRVGKHHLTLSHTIAGELTFDADNLVGNDRLGLGEPFAVSIKEHLDAAGRILDLNDPVTFGTRRDRTHHTDKTDLLIRKPVSCPDKSFDRDRTDPAPHHGGQRIIPVAKHRVRGFRIRQRNRTSRPPKKNLRHPADPYIEFVGSKRDHRRNLFWGDDRHSIGKRGDDPFNNPGSAAFADIVHNLMIYQKSGISKPGNNLAFIHKKWFRLN